MRKIFLGLFGLLASISLANAADDYTATQGSGTTFGAKDVGAGRLFPYSILADTTGAAIGVTANPLIVSGIGIANATAFVAQTFSPVMGLANTSAPTTADATLYALSLNGAGALRTTNVSLGATAASVPASAVYMGVNVGGNLVGLAPGTAGTASTQVLSVQTPAVDPCQNNVHSYQPISQTTSTQLFAGTSAKKTYVCHIFVIANAAETVTLVSGTGTVCATSPHAMIGPGSVTALSALSANSGFSLGNGGYAIAASTTNADNVCLVQLGSVQLTGVISYVSQ